MHFYVSKYFPTNNEVNSASIFSVSVIYKSPKTQTQPIKSPYTEIGLIISAELIVNPSQISMFCPLCVRIGAYNPYYTILCRFFQCFFVENDVFSTKYLSSIARKN